MATYRLDNFDAQIFLRDHWQKKPLLLSEALPDYECPLSPEVLAGLSLETDIESRIIIDEGDNKWAVKNGPFTEKTFTHLKGQTWTLLVQAVDQWVDEIHELKALFDFIPSFRLDDIMVSFAPKGGSVGPHFDQYDVFLIQAEGQRLWQIGEHCDDNNPHLDSNVKILADFKAEESQLLNVGDILYIPPGVAHHGVSQSDDCMTISIGFRAPSHEEIIDSYLTEISDQLTESQRYQDPDLSKQLVSRHPAEITHNTLQALQSILKEHLNNPLKLIASFGKLMTEQRYEHDDYIEYEEGQTYVKRLDARLAYFKADNKLLIFANGRSFTAELDQEAFIQQTCDTDFLETLDLSDVENDISQALIACGIYEFANDE